jgi:hypothetical protein
MDENHEGYDPSQVNKDLRRRPEQIDKYLTNKGLKCVAVEAGPLAGFEVDRYYTTGPGEKTSPPKHLPNFLEILKDYEIVIIGKAMIYDTGEYDISYRAVDKTKFKEKDPFFQNYRGLIYATHRLPYSDDKIIRVDPTPEKDVRHENVKSSDDAIKKEPGKIQESRLLAVHQINPVLFAKYYCLLKIQNVLFDLSEFEDWFLNW